MSVQYSIDDPNDVHVVIEGETPAGSTRRSTGGDNGAAELQRERLARAQAERQNQLIAAQNAMTEARLEADVAERDYAAAAELGDFARQGQATRRLSAAESKLANAEAWQASLQRQPVSTGDVVEDFCQRLSPESAAWMRNHRDLAADPRGMSRIQGAHHLAVGDGEVPDSPGYFAAVERHLNLRGGNGNGSSRSGGGGDGRSVTLSASEKKTATDGTLTWNYNDPNGKFKKGDPIGVQEYGRRKLALQASGQWNKQG
jgi:hypothetical protein